MRARNVILPIVAMLVSAAAPVCGQMITQTETFGPNTPPFDTVLTFNSYAGPLSHIVSIEVTWNMSIAGGFLVIDNDATNPASGTYEFGAQISIDGANTDVTLLDGSFQQIFTSTQVTNAGAFNLGGNVGDGSNDFDASGPDGVAVVGQPATDNGGAFVNDLFLSQFVSGLGGAAGSTFDIAIQNQQYLNVTSNGGTEYAITPVDANGSVTITYTLVPEPSTALMGGLALLLSLRRRRR